MKWLVKYYPTFSRFFFLCLFIFERGWGQRERETQNLKQAPGSEVSAQSPTRVLNSQAMRSWHKLKWDSQPTEPLRHPTFSRLLMKQLNCSPASLYQLTSTITIYQNCLFIYLTSPLTLEDRDFINSQCVAECEAHRNYKIDVWGMSSQAWVIDHLSRPISAWQSSVFQHCLRILELRELVCGLPIWENTKIVKLPLFWNQWNEKHKHKCKQWNLDRKSVV